MIHQNSTSKAIQIYSTNILSKITRLTFTKQSVLRKMKKKRVIIINKTTKQRFNFILCAIKPQKDRLFGFDEVLELYLYI